VLTAGGTEELLLGDLKATVGTGHETKPVVTELLEGRGVVKVVCIAVEIADVLGAVHDLADPQQIPGGFQVPSILLGPVDQQLTAGNGGVELVLFLEEQLVQVLHREGLDHVGDLVDGEAEVLEPQTVQQEIDILEVIIAVVVVLALHGHDHAFFFIIPQKVWGDTENFCDIADFIFHGVLLLIVLPLLLCSIFAGKSMLFLY
jgi:hypothetical protein